MVSQEIRYREAEQKDLPQLQRLQQVLNVAREQQFVEQTKKFHERRRPPTAISEEDLKKDLFVIAAQGDMIVGYAWGQLAERASSVLSKLGYLEEVCVDGSVRGQGIAKELIKKLEERFKEKGCDHMTTHTDAENMAARALYASVGMHEATVEFWKDL